jgi:hypothetical protein
VIVKCCSILLASVIVTVADTVIVSIARTCKSGPDTCISKCCNSAWYWYGKGSTADTV